MKRYRSILVGVDLTPEGNAISLGSRRAALQGQWLAEKTGASLTLFHSTWADIYEDERAVHGGPGPEALAALEELRENYGASGIPTELVLHADRCWNEITRRVMRGDNDLVIVGRRPTKRNTTLGSVSRKLMRKCPAPVWVVKPEAKLVSERIMAATDLTPVGDRAVALAASIAVAYGCELHVVHAWKVPLSVQMSAEWRDEKEQLAILNKIDDDAEKHIVDALREAVPAAKPILHVGNDSPSRCIREGVKKLDVDLLVMGTVSRGGIAGVFVGNTAEKLLDRLQCSVLTIKPEDFVSPIQLG
jgi:nucleotide-binding universal stress UspA family protein